MKSPHVYDKAKYHHNTVAEHNLPHEHAFHHTAVFLRWLIENRLMSDFFEEEQKEDLNKFRIGKISILEIYSWWDGCLVDDMLSKEGNAFALYYFDFKQGRYIHDYIAALKGSLPTEFHVKYTNENYQIMQKTIDRKDKEWKKPKWSWWPFRKKDGA